jgi:hypothetical protein
MRKRSTKVNNQPAHPETHIYQAQHQHLRKQPACTSSNSKTRYTATTTKQTTSFHIQKLIFTKRSNSN